MKERAVIDIAKKSSGSLVNRFAEGESAFPEIVFERPPFALVRVPSR